MSRRAYCAELGVPVTTFDYWRQRQLRERRERAVVPVELIGVTTSTSRGFALVLGNGRRIEAEWGFAAEELAKLVRVAEQA